MLYAQERCSRPARYAVTTCAVRQARIAEIKSARRHSHGARSTACRGPERRVQPETRSKCWCLGRHEGIGRRRIETFGLGNIRSECPDDIPPSKGASQSAASVHFSPRTAFTAAFIVRRVVLFVFSIVLVFTITLSTCASRTSFFIRVRHNRRPTSTDFHKYRRHLHCPDNHSFLEHFLSS